MKPLFETDLKFILEHTRDLWQDLRGERLFITGGTGFFGCWLLESFSYINRVLGLKASATILSRDPQAFLSKMPHLLDRDELCFLRGDLFNFSFPEGDFPLIVHAATPSSDRLNREEPLQMFDTVVEGTRRVLEFAGNHGVQKMLLTSSGAVYGRQPTDLTHIPETYNGGPVSYAENSAYAEGKRAAECLSSIYGRQYGFEIKIARCFAFVGPHLPLDIHFAIGNFLRDALAGDPIIIRGDGTPLRSYLYSADLMVWLWTILFNGQSAYPYNVGSPEAVSIKTLAEKVAGVVNPDIKIEVKQAPDPSRPVERYIPDTQRAQTELGLVPWTGLEESVRRTATWIKG